MRINSIEDAKKLNRGRGRKGCAVCGERPTFYYTIHLRHPNQSQAGKNQKGDVHVPSKPGGTIISRNQTFCEKHLIEAWNEMQEVLDRIISPEGK